MQHTKTLQGNENATKRKSVALTDVEYKSLKKFIKAYTSLSEAAENLGVSRQVLDRMQLVRSGSGDSISLIRQKLSEVA